METAAAQEPDETPEEYEATVQIRCANAVRADRQQIADRLQNGVRQDLHAGRMLIERAGTLLAAPTLPEDQIREYLAAITALVRTATTRVVRLEDELRNPDLAALKSWRESPGL